MNKQETIVNEDGSEFNIILSTVENAKAFVIFAHGAGANMSHEYMNDISELLNASGIIPILE